MSEIALLTTREISSKLRISESGLRKMAREGRIPHIRLGKKILFDPETIAGWIQAQQRRFFEIER